MTFVVGLTGNIGSGKSTVAQRFATLGATVIENSNLSVEENLLMGAAVRRAGPWVLERIYALFPILKERRNQQGGNLSGGEQQMLAIGRALMSHPRLLLLDEPSMGLAPMIVARIFEILGEINAQGTTILLTTHYLEEVEQMCRNCAIIKEGEIVLLDSVRNLLATIPQDTYRITVKEMLSLEGVLSFNPVKIDEHTLDVEIRKRHTRLQR